MSTDDQYQRNCQQAFQQESDGTYTVGTVKGIPNLTEGQPNINEVAAWFLGPRAENSALLTELVNDGLSHITNYRDSYLPGDPKSITSDVQESPGYQRTVIELKQKYKALLDYLYKNASPYFSMRYQAHMLWDTTLPSIAAYFATMLHNPNNLTIQASTSTVPLEILVSADLCEMIGFPSTENAQPCAHLVSNGSLSVTEGVWATREMKFFPLATRMALLCSKDTGCPDYDNYQKLAPAYDIEVNLVNGTSKRLLDASNWELFNIKMDDIFALPQHIADLCDISNVYDVWDLIVALNANVMGLANMLQAINQEPGKVPVMLVPSTKHYCWPKAAAVMGYGSKQMLDVYVDNRARMNISELRAKLEECFSQQIPVTTVTCVHGTTEESAVDPIAEVLVLREEYRARGFEFNIHVDAAWGGYVVSTIRKPYGNLQPQSNQEGPFIEDHSKVPLSDYTIEQTKKMRECDSVTIDPHKYGYIQYPAGAILYRNHLMRRLTIYSGPYIGGVGSVNPGDAPTVGSFGLDGSRPGAAAAAVFLSHACIRPDENGYGQLIKYSLFNARKFYVRLWDLSTTQEYQLNFDLTLLDPLPIPSQLPIPCQNSDVEEVIRTKIFDKTVAEILADPEAMCVFRHLGPDQCIVDYVFNFIKADGSLNTDPDTFYNFNQAIYDAFHVEPGTDIHEKDAEGNYRYPFILSMTIFGEEYGNEFRDDFVKRIGITGVPGNGLICLRSVVMNPYLSDTQNGSFFAEIIDIIRNKVCEIAQTQFGARCCVIDK